MATRNASHFLVNINNEYKKSSLRVIKNNYLASDINTDFSRLRRPLVRSVILMSNMEKLMKEIEKWSAVYEFSFQFWGEDNNNVYINKHGIELASFGGEKTIADIFKRTLDWVKNENPKGYKRPTKIRRCGGCGSAIAEGNDYCGECLCEDDLE